MAKVQVVRASHPTARLHDRKDRLGDTSSDGMDVQLWHATGGGGRRIVILVQGDVGVRTLENRRVLRCCTVRARAEGIAPDRVQAHGARVEGDGCIQIAH